MKATAGHVLEESLSEVLLAGVRPLGAAELDAVDAAIKQLKLDREVAKSVFADVSPRGGGGIGVGPACGRARWALWQWQGATR